MKEQFKETPTRTGYLLAMSRPEIPSQLPEPSIEPTSGWHCTHMYYRLNRALLSQLNVAQRHAGAAQLASVLDSSNEYSPARLQSFIVSGHKADFGFLAFDPDPLKIDRVHQRLLDSELGPALEATYSFVSLTEISEYVLSPTQYAKRLITEGEDPDAPQFAAKVAAYEKRLPAMNAQRLNPELPPWTSMCFYPMNKSRVVGANWFTTPFSSRNSMMSEHAHSGMAFAGKVTQIVTVSVGMDDWEWGVTLWARRPDFLKDIVYKMRFDEASAKYAEFGPFFVGYVADGLTISKHCGIV